MSSIETCMYIEQCCAVVSAPTSHDAFDRATQDLLKFKQSSAPYQTCFMLLERKTSPTALYHAIITIQSALTREYGHTLSYDETQDICRHLLQFACDNIGTISEFLITSICRVLAIAKVLVFPKPSSHGVLKAVLLDHHIFSKATDDQLYQLSQTASPDAGQYVTQVRQFLLSLSKDILSLFESSNPNHVQLGCMYISALASEVCLPTTELSLSSSSPSSSSSSSSASSGKKHSQSGDSSSSSSSHSITLNRVIFHLVSQTILNPFFTQIILQNIERMLVWLKSGPYKTLTDAVSSHGSSFILTVLDTNAVASIFSSQESTAALKLLSLLFSCLVSIFDWNWLDGDLSRLIDIVASGDQSSSTKGDTDGSGPHPDHQGKHASHTNRHNHKHGDSDDDHALASFNLIQPVLLESEWRTIFTGGDEYLAHDYGLQQSNHHQQQQQQQQQSPSQSESQHEQPLPSIVMLRNIPPTPGLSTYPSSSFPTSNVFTLDPLLQQSSFAASMASLRPISRIVFDIYSYLLQSVEPLYIQQMTFKHAANSSAFTPESNYHSKETLSRILESSAHVRGTASIASCFRYIRRLIPLLFKFKGDCFGDVIDHVLQEYYTSSSSSASSASSSYLVTNHSNATTNTTTSLSRTHSLEHVEKLRTISGSSALYHANDKMKCNIHYKHHIHRLILCLMLSVGDYCTFLQLHYKYQQTLFLHRTISALQQNRHPTISFDEPDAWIIHVGNDTLHTLLSCINLVGFPFLVQLPIFIPILTLVQYQPQPQPQQPQQTQPITASLFHSILDWEFVQSLLYTTFRFYTDRHIQKASMECLHYGKASHYTSHVTSFPLSFDLSQMPRSPSTDASSSGPCPSPATLPAQLSLHWTTGIPLLLGRILLGCLYPNLHINNTLFYKQFSSYGVNASSSSSPSPSLPSPIFLTPQQTEVYAMVYGLLHTAQWDSSYHLLPSDRSPQQPQPASTISIANPYSTPSPLLIEANFSIDISSISPTFTASATLTPEQQSQIGYYGDSWHKLICHQYSSHVSWCADAVDMLTDVWQLLANYSNDLLETYGQHFLTTATTTSQQQQQRNKPNHYPIQSIEAYQHKLGEIAQHLTQQHPQCIPSQFLPLLQHDQGQSLLYHSVFPLVTSQQTSSSLIDSILSPVASNVAITLISGMQMYLYQAQLIYYNALLVGSFDDRIYTITSSHQHGIPNGSTATTKSVRFPNTTGYDHDDDYNGDDDDIDGDLQDLLDDQYNVDTFHRIASVLRSNIPTTITLLSNSFTLHIHQLQSNHQRYYENDDTTSISPQEIELSSVQRDVCLEILVNILKMSKNVICNAFSGEKPTPSSTYLTYSLLLKHITSNNSNANIHTDEFIFRIPQVIFTFSHAYHQLLISAFRKPSPGQPFTSTKSSCLSSRLSQYMMQFYSIYIQSYFNISQQQHALPFYHPQLPVIFSPQSTTLQTYTQISLEVIETILALWSEESSICLTTCVALRSLMEYPQICFYVVLQQPQRLQSLIALFMLASLSSPILSPFISQVLSVDTLPMVIKEVIQLHLPMCKQFSDIYTLNRFTDAVFSSFTHTITHILHSSLVFAQSQSQQNGQHNQEFMAVSQSVTVYYQSIMDVLALRVKCISETSLTVYGTELGNHILHTDYQHFQQAIHALSSSSPSSSSSSSPSSNHALRSIPPSPHHPSLLSKVSMRDYIQQKNQVLQLVRGNFTIISAMLTSDLASKNVWHFSQCLHLFHHTLALALSLPIYEEDEQGASSLGQLPRVIDDEVYDMHQFICNCISNILEHTINQLSTFSMLLVNAPILRYLISISNSQHTDLLQYDQYGSYHANSLRGGDGGVDGSNADDEEDDVNTTHDERGGLSVLDAHTINLNDTFDLVSDAQTQVKSHLSVLIFSILQYIMNRVKLSLYGVVPTADLNQMDVGLIKDMGLATIAPLQSGDQSSIQGSSSQFHLIILYIYHNLSSSLTQQFLLSHYNILETFFYSIPSLIRISLRALCLSSPYFIASEAIPVGISITPDGGQQGQQQPQQCIVGSSLLANTLMRPIFAALQWGISSSYDDIIRLVYSAVHQISSIQLEYLRQLAVYSSGGRPKGETRKVLDIFSQSIRNVFKIDPPQQSGLYLPPVPSLNGASTSSTAPPPPCITLYNQQIQIDSTNSFFMLFLAAPDAWILSSPVTQWVFEWLECVLSHFLRSPISSSILHNECADALYSLLIAVCGIDDLHAILASTQQRITNDRLSQLIDPSTLAHAQQHQPTPSQSAVSKGLVTGFSIIQSCVARIISNTNHGGNGSAINTTMLSIIQQLFNNASPPPSQSVILFGTQIPTVYPYSIGFSDNRPHRNAFKALLKDVHTQIRLAGSQ